MMKYKKLSKITNINESGNIHILVLAGGMSNEENISLKSSQNVVKSLARLGYRVTLLDVGVDVASLVYKLNPDLVFNCLHGTYGEDGCIPGILNIMGIPYTNTGVLGSALAFNKAKSYELFKLNNIICPDWQIITKKHKINTDPIERPYVIKPINQGSSIGVEIILNNDDFDFKSYNFEYGDRVIVQKYIRGREFHVAILNGKALNILETKPIKTRFYDYKAKYTTGYTSYLFPTNITSEVRKNTMDLAEKISNILCSTKGICTVDLIYEEISGIIYAIELNTHPGITNLSICPKIASFCGIEFDQLIQQIISTASCEN